MAVADLDSQQKEMVRLLLEMMLRPFRTCDAAEVRECLDVAGGADKLHLTFFKEGDIGHDGVWDIWKLEGPAFSWYFRGCPARAHLAERGTQGMNHGDLRPRAGGSSWPWLESNGSSGWKGDSTSTGRTSNGCNSTQHDY